MDLGLVGIKDIDLPPKLRRNTKIHRAKENKRILGHSIETIPEEIETREEFGHWETDLVINDFMKPFLDKDLPWPKWKKITVTVYDVSINVVLKSVQSIPNIVCFFVSPYEVL